MRKWKDRTFAAVVALCALSCVSLVFGLIATIVWRGAPALNWSFLTRQIQEAGAGGGIFWNVVGTLILLATAFLACAPVALSLALLERVWLRHSSAQWAVRTTLYGMNGLPSILFGILGFVIFVKWCGWGKSWLAGGLVLAMCMIPTVTITLIERIAAIPRKYAEAAAALGLSEEQIVRAVLVPQAWTGLITGSVLGLARAAGETAPIMFTAAIFAGASFPSGIKENPVLTLPYHIFILAQDSSDPAVGPKLWGAALVLLGIVFILSLVALPGRLRIHEEANT